LSPPPFPNIDSLETHLSKTSIPLYYLLLESLGLTSLELDHICSHIGLCVGIVTTIRGVPFRLKLNELPLPLDICAKYHLVQEQVFRQGAEAPGFKDVIFELATRANDHLVTARQYIKDLKGKDPNALKSGFCVFLSAVSTSSLILLTRRSFRENIWRSWKRLISIHSYVNQGTGNFPTECGGHTFQATFSQYARIFITNKRTLYCKQKPFHREGN